MQVQRAKKACVAVYPSIVQNKIVWFWPSTDPQYKDIALKEKPPYVPQLDDPSYTSSMGMRDLQYGYMTFSFVPKLYVFNHEYILIWVAINYHEFC